MRTKRCCVSGSSKRAAIGRRSPDEGTFESVLSVTVPRSRKPAADSNRAMRMTGKEPLSKPRAFWDGNIESDEDYERRHASAIGAAS
jgi:hypothetical protein